MVQQRRTLQSPRRELSEQCISRSVSIRGLRNRLIAWRVLPEARASRFVSFAIAVMRSVGSVHCLLHLLNPTATLRNRPARWRILTNEAPHWIGNVVLVGQFHFGPLGLIIHRIPVLQVAQ